MIARGFLRQRLKRTGRWAPPPLPAGPYRETLIGYEPVADVDRLPPAAPTGFDEPVSSTAPMTIPAEAWVKHRSTLPSPAPEPFACCPSCKAPLTRR